MPIARTVAVALLVLAATALPAHAAVTLTSVTLQPTTAQAGAHPDVTVDAQFAQNPASDDVKSLTVLLPQGLVGDPNAATLCSASALEADACPASSKIGTTQVSAIASVVPGVLDVPQTSDGDVYDLEPQGTEPARIGVVVRPAALNLVPLPKIVLQSPITLGPDTNYGLRSVFDNLPRTAGPFSIRITELKLTLNGMAAKGPFITNPTDCRTGTMTATATSYDQPGAASSANATLTPIGCDKLPFAPALSGTLGGAGQTEAHTSPTLTTAITMQPGMANPARVTVTLPPTVATNTAGFGRFCLAATFAAGACPPAATVGRATATSPVLRTPLSGPVVFAGDPRTGGPALVVELGGAVPLTLFGQLGLAPDKIANTFDGIPDLPIGRFQLTIDGGNMGLLANTRDICAPGAPNTAQGTLLAHSGTTATISAPLAVQGCGQASSSLTGSDAGKPRVTLGLSFRHGVGTLTSRVSAGRGAPRVRRLQITLPAGLRPPSQRAFRVGAARRLSSRAVRVQGRTVVITVSGSGASRLSLRSTGITPSASLKRRLGKRPRLSFRTRVTNTSGRATAFTLKLRPVVR